MFPTVTDLLTQLTCSIPLTMQITTLIVGGIGAAAALWISSRKNHELDLMHHTYTAAAAHQEAVHAGHVEDLLGQISDLEEHIKSLLEPVVTCDCMVPDHCTTCA